MSVLRPLAPGLLPLLLLLLGAAAAAAVPSAACKTDMDCSLNGACTAGACVCHSPWKSGKEACNRLDILPHPNDYAPAYGGLDHSTEWAAFDVTSWGGNVVAGSDGQYHLYVSEMAQGGLSGWGHESQITHAVAKDPLGRFEKHDISLPKWAHNASPLQMKNGTILLFHIGTGFVHYASSPNGPWTSLPSIGCNNPAPFYHANGTLYCGCNSGGVALYRSTPEGGLPLAWEKVTTLHFPDIPSWDTPPYIKVEDPFLWVDNQSNFHMIAHRYDYRDGYPVNPNQTMPVLVSGHAFSTDGYNWGYNAEQPYDPVVRFENGTVQPYSTFERPHLLLDEHRNPTHLYNGVSPYWGSPACNRCDARPGTEHSCVVCKTSKGVDYTYTLSHKLNLVSA